MKLTTGLAAMLLLLVVSEAAHATFHYQPFRLQRINRQLHGQVLDFTRNHGEDRRIWSPALGEHRDLYVYLPPGYSPAKSYPIIVYLHGFSQDETSFLTFVVRPMDEAIARRQLPPVILAAPDGSITGQAGPLRPGSFYINSPRGGRFQDYLEHDVWNFLVRHFPIRPERQAHVLMGASMGGLGAYNLALKRRDLFGTVVGIFPPLNPRYLDCEGRYLSKFDPACWGWRTDFTNDREVIGIFFRVLHIRAGRLLHPLFDIDDPNLVNKVAAYNPTELLTSQNVRPGELEMFVGYGSKDEFNLDAQIESFLHRARQLGLAVTSLRDPCGHHGPATARRMLPNILDWLRPRLAPYSPR